MVRWERTYLTESMKPVFQFEVHGWLAYTMVHVCILSMYGTVALGEIHYT